MIEVNSWLIANKEHLPPVLVPQDPKKDTTDEVTLAALSENKLFNALICAELETVGANIKSYERPQHWRLISEPFTQENQMLTPKMSLRRANILKKYQTLINDVYRKEEGYPSICE